MSDTPNQSAQCVLRAMNELATAELHITGDLSPDKVARVGRLLKMIRFFMASAVRRIDPSVTPPIVYPWERADISAGNTEA